VTDSPYRGFALGLLAFMLFLAPACSQQKEAVAQVSASPAETRPLTEEERLDQQLRSVASLYHKVEQVNFETKPEDLQALKREIEDSRVQLEGLDWDAMPEQKLHKEQILAFPTKLQAYYQSAMDLQPFVKELVFLKENEPERFEARRDELKDTVLPLVTESEAKQADFIEASLGLCKTTGFKPMIAQAGIKGLEAPPLHLTQWHNLPAGKPALEVTDFRGKVLVLYFFQSWCPGCHERGFPLIKSLKEHYQSNSNVAFVTVQTVFEGYESNTFEKGIETLAEFALNIPMAQDGSAGQRSSLLDPYMTGGTPWIIIIDQKGVVQFNGFRIEPEEAVTTIDSLLSTESS
jgi:thiol-disulfide isomerase/thioredoxin